MRLLPPSGLLRWTAPSLNGAATRRPRMRRFAVAALVAVLLPTAGYFAATRYAVPEHPQEGSVEVGFLRDMSVHHSQAVTLGMLAFTRATKPAVRDMAEDIVRHQQWEVGVMAGWLQQWGLPTSTTAPAMAWMSHGSPAAADADPPMPGMANRRDVARLAVTRGRAADVLFCRLMLAHHLGGMHMINEVLKRATRPEVTALAQQMRIAQQRELTLLDRYLSQLAT